MITEATTVYVSGVRWGVYSMQQCNRPLAIKLTSQMSMEEYYIIWQHYMTRVKKLKQTEGSLNIYVKIEEKSVPNCGVNLLNRIR